MITSGYFSRISAHLSGGCLAVLQRGGHGQLSPDPEVALVEMGQELAAEPRAAERCETEEHNARRRPWRPVGQGEAQRRVIEAMQPAHDEGLGFLHLLRQQQGGEHRRHGERGDQRARQRISVGARHGPEDRALDALHGEQRHERRHDDEHGEQHRLVHLHGADQDQAQAVASNCRSAGYSHRTASDPAPRCPPIGAGTAVAASPPAPGNCGKCSPPGSPPNPR